MTLLRYSLGALLVLIAIGAVLYAFSDDSETFKSRGNSSSIDRIVADIEDKILNYLTVALIISTAAMSFVEVMKALFPFRRLFHATQVGKWLHSNKLAIMELHRIMAARDGAHKSAEFYDQKTSKLMAQIQAAATTALDFPGEFPRLYGVLTEDSAKSPEERRHQEEARRAPQRPLSAEPAGYEDHEVWQRNAERFSLARGTEPLTENDEIVQKAAQARVRLGTFIERKLDALQNRLEKAWRLLNQVAAIVIGFLIFEVMFEAKGVSSNPIAIFFSGTGAFAAPLMKDLYVALCSLRPRNT